MDLSLKRLVIQNFKSIRRLEMDALDSLVLLMGRNNAGKSNCLDAFKFLADATTSFEHALAERGKDFLEVAHRKKAGEKMEFTFDFAIDPAHPQKRAEIIGRLFAGNKFMAPGAAVDSDFLATLRLRVVIGAEEFAEELSTPNFNGNDWFTIFSLKGTPETTEVICGQLESLCKRCSGELPSEPMALEQTAEGPFRLRLGRPDACPGLPISQELAEAVRHQFSDLEYIDPMRRLPVSAPILGEHVLAPDASNLPDVLHWLHNNKPKQFRRIETEVGKLIPQLGRLYTPTVQNAATLGMIDSVDEDLVFSMSQLSFGTRSVVAVVSKVILARPGCWVCVEEPETYLHPQAQMALFHFLREEARTKRIYVATHSTSIAASCPLSALFIVERDAAQTTVARAVSAENAAAVIEQLGVKPSFNFEADAIVFVEQEEHVPLLEAWAQKFAFHVKTQFLSAEGAATLHYHANTRIALSKFVHTLVFAVFGTGRDVVRKKIAEHLKLPPEQILTIDFPIEAAETLPEPVRQFFEKIESAAKPYWRI
ncbi:MAG TPA: AAA family ATPase [Verrucomicrobiae bacterium]|jgi:predicted ATPase|nr:AAA family ATPase [Verrucomicrobiae bacterium]